MVILESSQRQPDRLSDHVTTALLARLAERVATAGAREAREIEMPFTGKTLGTVPRCTPDDVRDAVRRSRAAQAEWAEVPVRTRAQIFLRFHDLVLERQAE